MFLHTDIQALHPNGFKITAALNISGKDAMIKNEKGIHDGAALQVTDLRTGVLLNLSPNSAVLFLLAKFKADSDALIDDAQAEWLYWEASQFQRATWSFLQGCVANKVDAAATAALLKCLSQLEQQLKLSTFICGHVLEASDVVIYSSLLLLTATPSAAPLLANYSSVQRYIGQLSDIPAIKVAFSLMTFQPSRLLLV
ncbi:uncharacterized protein LOC108670867 [Hyalella azteca]|uniref:Uncharacterized protein LOC108670867 n=1 Tax=Hyalella azteca TaxID=294128 RepID=A0A8B7NKN6_HYAAZ|nr:uncharacterized protein LOC108670867 [Hyalella azteca]